MRPYRINSTDSFMYEIRFWGILVRRLPALSYDRARAQVDRANDLWEADQERLNRIYAARNALAICGKLTKSRAKWTGRTLASLNKLRAVS